jgi:hypothetical protein
MIKFWHFLSVAFRKTARYSFFESNEQKTKNAQFYGTQRAKNVKILTCTNDIEVTKVEPDGLGTQRRCLSAIEDKQSEQAQAPHINGPRGVLWCGALSLLQIKLKISNQYKPKWQRSQ